MNKACALALFLLLLGSSSLVPVRAAAVPRVDRVIVIVLENQEAGNILSRDPSQSKTPKLRAIALQQRIATNYFGVTHPSEPNYVSMIGGDHYDFESDAGSCFSRKLKLDCHKTDAPNLVDGLESKHISWMALMQSMPSTGYLGADYFFTTTYAEKHNPFIFFSDIATNPKRMAHIHPLGTADSILPILADAHSAPQFLYIVPDLCHDMHGAPQCRNKAELYGDSDAYVSALIGNIVHSPAFTDKSAIILTWDEGSSDLACCGLARGGGRIATIVIRKKPLSFRSDVSYNHYSLTATIEAVWGLPRIGHTNDRMPDGTLRFAPMLDLLAH